MHARGDDPASAVDRVGDTRRGWQDTAELARREIRAIQGEAMTGARRFVAGGTLLAGTGLCGVLALTAVHEPSPG